MGSSPGIGSSKALGTSLKSGLHVSYIGLLVLDALGEAVQGLEDIGIDEGVLVAGLVEDLALLGILVLLGGGLRGLLAGERHGPLVRCEGVEVSVEAHDLLPELVDVLQDDGVFLHLLQEGHEPLLVVLDHVEFEALLLGLADLLSLLLHGLGIVLPFVLGVCEVIEHECK